MNRLTTSQKVYFPKSIIEQMDKVIQFPLTVIEAPMGYGKSTAAKNCLNNSNMSTVWLRVSNNDVFIFWQNLCDKVKEYHPVIGKKLEVLGFPKDDITIHEALKIIHDIELQESVVFVVDDYHLLASEPINQFIECLVDNEIINFHIVLITRYMDLNRMEEYKLKSLVLHITMETFEFSKTDIKAYFRTCGIYLKEVDLEKTYQLTEGWISAIYLLMISYMEKGNIEDVKDIFKLVESVVYQKLSTEFKELIQILSFFNGFNLQLVEALNQNPEVKIALDEMIQKNAFVYFDSDSNIYYMHNLFTKYLKYQFEKKEITQKTKAYIQIAQIYRSQSDYEHALAYYYLAQDFESIMTTIQEDRGNCMSYDKKDALMAYFEQCPQAIKNRHPIATLIYAISLFTYNEIEKFQYVCQEFTAFVHGNEELSELERSNLLGELELVYLFAKYNDIDAMYEQVEKASKLMNRPNECLDTKTSWTFGSPSVMFMFYREVGCLDIEVKKLRETIGIYNYLTGGHGAGGELMMEAEVFFHRGDFDNAEILMYKGLYNARQKKQYGVILCGLFLHIRILMHRGDYETVQKILQNMYEEVNTSKSYDLVTTAQLCEAFVFSNLDQLNKIYGWIIEAGVEVNNLYFPIKPFFNIILSRVLIAQGDYLRLIGMSEQFLAEASIFPNMLSLGYAHIFYAIGNEKIYRRSVAVESLKVALGIFAPDNLVIPFVENVEFLMDVLNDIQSEGLFKDEIGIIKSLSSNYTKSIKGIKQRYFTQAKVELTQREMEIANLASLGYTNNQIGEKLFISENTVKAALKSIFSKLSINNRALLKQYITKETTL